LNPSRKLVLQVAIGDRSWALVDIAESAAAIDRYESEMAADKARFVSVLDRGGPSATPSTANASDEIRATQFPVDTPS